MRLVTANDPQEIFDTLNEIEHSLGTLNLLQ